MIHIPTAEFFNTGDVTYKGTLGIYDGTRISVGVGIDFAATDQLEIGATALGSNNLISHAQFTFMEFKDLNHLKVAGGFHAILHSEDLSQWEQYPTLVANQLGHYVVLSFEALGSNIHVGYSQPHTKVSKGSGSGILNTLSNFGNIFFGFEHGSPKDGSFIAEYDGIDFNIGYRYHFDSATRSTLSYTNILQQQNSFENLDTTTQLFSIDVAHTINYYSKLIEDVRRTQKELKNSQESYDVMSKQYQSLRGLFDSLGDDYENLKEEFGTIQRFKEDLENLQLQIRDENEKLRIKNENYRKLLQEDPSRRVETVKNKFLLEDPDPQNSGGSFRQPTQPKKSTFQNLSQ
jgi:prefoldin subunit 5